MLMRLLQQVEKEKQSPEQINGFENALAILLFKKDIDFLSVDYHPDRTLEEAADAVGLDLGMATLPIKTTMHIDGEKITVRCGYGADAEVLA
jgi:hypothetical protein